MIALQIKALNFEVQWVCHIRRPLAAGFLRNASEGSCHFEKRERVSPVTGA